MKLKLITNVLATVTLSIASSHAAALSYSNDFESGLGGVTVGDGLWGGAGTDDSAGQPGGAGDGDSWAFFQTGTDGGQLPANASAGLVVDLGQTVALVDGNQLNYSLALGARSGNAFTQTNGFTLEFYDGDPTGAGTQIGSTFTYTPNYDEAYAGGAGTEVDSISGSLTLPGDTTNNLFVRYYFDGSANGSSYEQGLLNDITVTQTAVPEPSSTALFALGGLTLCIRRRK